MGSGWASHSPYQTVMRESSVNAAQELLTRVKDLQKEVFTMKRDMSDLARRTAYCFMQVETQVHELEEKTNR